MSISLCTVTYCFFFNDTATTEIYTLSLHDALPISRPATETEISGETPLASDACSGRFGRRSSPANASSNSAVAVCRSEEHTSELQSRQYLVCRLLLEKKNLHCVSSVKLDE